MVNWHAPALVLQDYFVLTKLVHAVGGLYIWETVFSAGFELNVLRGKQPYRWTIWIYLGTRYSCLLMFTSFFILSDAGRVPCKLFIILNYAFDVLTWAFASLIIVLRIIAIWDRNPFVSSISISAWSTGLGLNIRCLWAIGGEYNSIFNACVALNTHTSLVGTIAIPAVDTILFTLMLVGLLRRAHGNKVGIWRVLYNQCIIWMIVAAFAEIPPMVFVILNLNPPWNLMFPGVAAAIISICASRMYRSLCMQGSFTEYSSSESPYTAGLPLPNGQRRSAYGANSPLHFRTGTGTTTVPEVMTVEPFVFVPTAEQMQIQMQADFVPGAAVSPITTLTVPARTKSKDVQAGYRLSWHRPVDASMGLFE